MAKILIVEDSEFERELLSDLLGSAGHEVVEVPAAHLAFEAAKRERPRLVVMDIDCPGPGDGLRAIAELRADPATRGLAVVAMSGHLMDNHIAKAREAGCDDYVFKPYDFDAFLAVVARHLPPEAR